MSDSEKPQADLEALERFVIENDDLLELEERIGRFNIFDALRIERKEIQHSNFLSWLLDPNESHGQGDLFLKAVLMDMLKRVREQALSPPISPVLLDGIELHDVEVRREWNSIDLLIIARKPAMIVAVENKVDSGEHTRQLERYHDRVASSFAGIPALFVFLAASEQEASDDRWVNYSYADLHRVLSRVRRIAGGSLGADVAVFLDHYLGLIGSRFMTDPKIEELCKRIYANHRRAIELVFDLAGATGSGVMSRFAELVSQSDLDCEVVLQEAKKVKLVPRKWLTLLPPIGIYKSHDPRAWLDIRLEIKKSHLFLQVRATQTTDQEYRNKVVEALTADGNPFGFKLSFPTWRGQRRIALWTDTIVRDIESDEIDDEVAATQALDSLRRLLPRLEGVADVLARVRSDGRR
ncbi:MAG: PD-(D/E)XK nuclease family protein [Phycisphaerae bacterium]|nr:PD-(D/E)XK nuclease family protein [Phycisphaerae bacterium]